MSPPMSLSEASSVIQGLSTWPPDHSGYYVRGCRWPPGDLIGSGCMTPQVPDQGPPGAIPR